MRTLHRLTLTVLCLGLAGCAMFGKKSANSSGPANKGGSPPPATAANDRGAAPTTDRSTPPPGVGGILAGQVIDSYNNKPPATTYIQVSEAGETGGAPIEVASDSQGYFTIQGLHVGQHYRLTARTKDGERLLAGTTWATPPNPKLLIRVSEDFATKNTPPVPAKPGWPAPSTPTLQPPPSWPEPSSGNKDQSWGPGRSHGGAPAGGNAGPANPPPPTRPENMVNGQDQIAKGKDPLANIRSPGDMANPFMGSRQTQQDSPSVSQGPAPVPSCVLTGQTLYNFALNDLNGQTYEFRNHRGKLVLLDFWGTWCVYCVQSIPHLKSLQQRYGPNGLEVIGIAYEEGTPQERLQKVNRVRQLREINYRLLLGGDRATCPVRKQFGVTQWPTLVLLDDSGRIIWRSTDGLDQQQSRELENIIKQRLGVR